jgi:predicted dehydrogenase
VLSVFDPDRASCVKALEKLESPSTAISASPEAAIAAPGVDWVLVFSPNVYHKAHIIAGFEAGKHVFSEKPLATTLADCAAIAQAHRKSGRLFATGFVLRFSPIYRKAK